MKTSAGPGLLSRAALFWLLALPQAAEERYVLDNGLEVILKPIDKAPLAVVAIAYRAGVVHEPAERHGLAHLVEHLVVRSATASYAAYEAEKAQIAAGPWNREAMDANAETLHEFVYFYSVCKPDKVEQAIAIEAERMRSCVFEAGVLRAEREKALAEVANVGANPAAQAWAKLQSLAYPKSREGLPKVGAEEPMKAATLDEAKAFYDAWYRPNNAVLVVYGAVDAAKVKEAIAAKFGVLKKAELPKLERPDADGAGRAEVRGEPRQVLVGWKSAPAGTKEKAALLLATYVLRVQRGDVHKKAKTAMLWDDPFFAGRSLVRFMAVPNEGVEPDDVAAAAQAWIDGIALDAKKVDAARANFRNDLAGNDAFQLGFVNRKDEKKYGQALAQIVINRAMREVGGGPGDLLKHAEALEVDDVKTAVTKYLAKEKAAIVVVK